MKTVSVVFPYYNRKLEFFKTLESFKKFEDLPDEIIIVDDASDIPLSLDELNEFGLNIKLHTVDKNIKTWINPCIPYNIGFKLCTSDITIISNPECYLYSDIIKYTKENLGTNDYFSYSCFSTGKDTDLANFNAFNNIGVETDGAIGWYNHSKFRPQGSHYTSAIHTDQLLKIGGMDERYANGIAWDDYGFQKRIKANGLNFKIVDDVVVIHQYHFSDNHHLYRQSSDYQSKAEINRKIFYGITK